MLNLLSLLAVVIKRLWHNLGLTISTLIGMVCVLTIIICVPIFSYTVSGELLRQQLAEQAAKAGHSLFSIRIYYSDLDSFLFDVDLSKSMTKYIAFRLTELMDLQSNHMVVEIHSPDLGIKPLSVGHYDEPDKPLSHASLMSLDLLPEHAQILEGKWPAPEASASGPLGVAIHKAVADKMGLKVGERYLWGDSIEIQIAGIWREIDPRHPIWFLNPAFAFSSSLWIHEDTYRARLDATLNDSVGYVSWYIVVDEQDLRFQRAGQYAQGLMRLNNDLNNLLPNDVGLYSPLEELMAYQERAESLTTQLYAVGTPMAVLALLFIGLTSNIAVRQAVQETATMRSRGISRSQVVTMNLMESVVLMAVALPVSFVSGWYATDVMSRTLSFLKFTARPLLPLTYDGLNFVLLGVTIVFIVGARFIPAWRISQRTIVKAKQERARDVVKPLWERFYLDFFLLLPGMYAYLVLEGWVTPEKLLGKLLAQLKLEDVSVQEAYRFLNQAGLPLNKLQSTGEPYRDPLLFVAPALFSMAVCMILLRLIPLVAQALAGLAEKLPGAWLYLSLQQIARRPQDHANALLLVMISLSLAIFAASAANTLDQWLFDSTYYGAGTDLVVREATPDSGMDAAGHRAESDLARADTSAVLTSADLHLEDSKWYLDRRQLLNLPGIRHATRVGRYRGKFSFGREEMPCWLMGIERMQFPQVAFFRDDFAPAPLGELMNALGAEPMGVLIPRHLAAEPMDVLTPSHLITTKRFAVGDRLSAVIDIQDLIYERDLVVVGIYDFFPTVYADERPTLVVNLDHIFGNPDAIVAHDVWLDLAEGADGHRTDIPRLVKEIGRAMSTEVYVRHNALETLRKGQDRAERVGLFGVLNIGFLTAGLMPGIGFVLYSYASLRQRFVQLGILQAIGLSVRQLVGHLASEQLLLMGIAVSSGAAIGVGISYLFVPFLQTGSSPQGQIPPFRILIGWTEAGWLSLSFAVVLFLTMLGTITYLVRLKVFEAVKLGETI